MEKKIFLAPLLSALMLLGTIDAAPQEPVDRQQAILMLDVEQNVDDNNAFAMDLYGQLKDGKGNLFISPYNISSALAMAYDGADGDTATQMAKALHFSLKKKELAKTFGWLNDYLTTTSGDSEYKLFIANALWVQTNQQIKQEFKSHIRDDYKATIQELDFQSEAEKARNLINAWVLGKTEGKISDLLPVKSIDSNTRFVITSTIYLKAPWQHTFKEKTTKPQPFYISEEQIVQTPIMQETNNFPYFKGDGFSLLELPYMPTSNGSPNLAMLVLLPDDIAGVAEAETNLSLDAFKSWLPQLKMEHVHVWLPKFTFSGEFTLNDVLKKMGMVAPFNRDADFSKMSFLKSLSISSIVHKTFLDVTEKGTEAAAATGVVIGVTSVYQPKEAIHFKADHPFLFFIIDKDTGLILFMGRLLTV